jgi:1,4-alpha-glucan branching enzyme
VIVVLALLGVRAGSSHRGAPMTTASAPHDTVYMVRFVLLAPDARTVALVGDFNNWNRATTTLAPAKDGLWTASVVLPPGRHEYAFIVDGEHWMADPQAKVTIEDDFGTASSIVTVGARQS